MKFPTLHGLIDRRILINYTADPGTVAAVLPAPFRPQLYNGNAIVGICLIRLKQVRPKGFPAFMGISSENGAHRIAVTWEEQGTIKTGVYIPRRDTSLRLNAWVGGRLFPGKHYLADFKVTEADNRYRVAFNSSDGEYIAIDAKETAHFTPASVFRTLENTSAFFQQGAIGYSPNGRKYDGMCLEIDHWKVRSLEVSSLHSSFFGNEALFPAGSVKFDHALLMTQTRSEWRSIADI